MKTSTRWRKAPICSYTAAKALDGRSASLENMGFLRKRINGGDRRGVLVSLSKHGEMAFNRVIPRVRRTNALLFENISKRELESARIVAEMLIANAEYAFDQLDLAQTQMHRR